MRNTLKVVTLINFALMMSHAGVAHSRAPAAEAANKYPRQGGYWVPESELKDLQLFYMNKPKTKYIKSKNLVDDIDPRCNPRENICYSYKWTRSADVKVDNKTVKIPTGFMQLGSAKKDGDFVLMGGYIGKTEYVAFGPTISDADEIQYPSCVTSVPEITRQSTIATNASSTYGSASSFSETNGTQTTLSEAIGAKIGATFSLDKVLGLSSELNTTVTSTMVSDHSTTASSEVSNSWTDSLSVSNSDIRTQKVKAGYIGYSGYTLPSVEIYGLFRLGRLLNPNPGERKLVERRIQGETRFKVWEQPEHIGRETGWWIGKITVPMGTMKTPGTNIYTKKRVFMQLDSMTVPEYRQYCNADLDSKKTVAPNMKAALCKAKVKPAITCAE